MTGSLSSMSSDQSQTTSSSNCVQVMPPVEACPNAHGFDVRIDTTHNYEEFTLYEIRVRYRYASWKVRRRYREFAELHSELNRLYTNGNSWVHAFPGKRMLGNFSKKFVERRRKKLEEYLRVAFRDLKAIPKPLAYFLDMQKYELNWIVHTLSESIYNRTQYNESLQLHLQRSRTFQLDTLQLHAIHQRMSLRILPDAYEMTEAAVNLAHLMDFAFNLRVLKVEGRRHRAGTSDWQLNQVPFSLSYFKSVKHLQLECVNLEMIEESSWDILTQHLVNLHCHKSVSSCAAVLNPTGLPNSPLWNSLVRLNLSKNNLSSIDESIRLAPKLQFLDLSYNHLNCIQNLSTLSSLRELNLSHNNFSYLEDLNTKLGNIKKLLLDHNKLFSLDGLAKVYSIEKLSCNANRLCELHDISAISRMPCLENLSLKENPICSILDYRTKVLEIFQDRAPELVLDGLMTTARELDTVRVLVALSKARSSRGLTRAHTFSAMPTTVENKLETPGVECSLRHSESRTFTRTEVQEIMEREKQDATEQMFENEKRPDTDFKPCAAVKKVKSGLVLGLTGEVSLIDWNTIIEADPLEETNSSPLLLQSSSAHATDLTRSSWHDPFALSVSGTSQNSSASAVAAVAVAEEEESYPSYLLWEQVTRSNKSAITSLPLSNGFRALASCDCRKFVNILHDQLICVPQQKERLRFCVWCYLQLKKSMSFPKQAIIFVTNLNVYVYFDGSGGCMLNTLDDNSSDKMARVANKNKRRVAQMTSKRRSLLNGHGGLVVPPIEELANNLYLVLQIPVNQFTEVQLSITGQCANVAFNDQNHSYMLVATMDSVDLQAFCDHIKSASVSCPLNLLELRDLIFAPQESSKTELNGISGSGLDSETHASSVSLEKPTYRIPGRIFFASNLMRLKINDEIQSAFPILVLSESFVCFCEDPLVVGGMSSTTEEKETKLEESQVVETATGEDATAECSTSKDQLAREKQATTAVEERRVAAMHKIANILILKMTEGSNNICLSVRTLAHCIEELSDSLELNLQEDYYDNTDESKQNGNLPISYIDFSFRLTKDKERFVFLLQKRFEDVAKKRIAIINN